MIFANSQYLLPGFVLFTAAVIFILWASRRQKHALTKLGDPSLIQKLSNNINWRGRRWRTALWLFALAMLIISLARPQWGSEVREIDQEGLQVMIALDVSQSMLADDIKPTRLARAKLEIAAGQEGRVALGVQGARGFFGDLESLRPAHVHGVAVEGRRGKLVAFSGPKREVKVARPFVGLLDPTNVQQRAFRHEHVYAAGFARHPMWGHGAHSRALQAPQAVVSIIKAGDDLRPEPAKAAQGLAVGGLERE